MRDVRHEEQRRQSHVRRLRRAALRLVTGGRVRVWGGAHPTPPSPGRQDADARSVTVANAEIAEAYPKTAFIRDRYDNTAAGAGADSSDRI